MPSTTNPHDVTIFPLYDAESARKPRHIGCMNSAEAISAELPPGTFVSAIEKGQAQGEIALPPGHYLLLEFSDDLEEFVGIVFIMDSQGKVKPGIGEAQTLNLSSWPPRHV